MPKRTPDAPPKRRPGRPFGVQLRVPVDPAAKPEPDDKQLARMNEGRRLLRLANIGRPVGLTRPGMLRHEAARVLATYGDDADERLAVKYLPYDERKALLLARRRRAKLNPNEGTDT